MTDRRHEELVDLVIRGGMIFDGGGGEPFAGDVAVSDGEIVAVGAVAQRGREEVDASGCIVTPGFVDVHTHYDGQAVWSQRLTPSSLHGVTTVVIGNCGVGFAPCRPGDRDLLVRAMEGVEDIPEVVMTEGLSWNWESFPDFLNVIDSRPHDIDIAAYLPHSALRVFVMGERGANREPATSADLERMKAVTREAMEAGAVGFATSRIAIHRRIDGEFIPSFKASEDELNAIASEVSPAGGIMQMVPELLDSTNPAEIMQLLELIRRVSQKNSVCVTFTLAQMDATPDQIFKILARVSEANAEPGTSLRPQVFPRPVGMIAGFDVTATPFLLCPSYKAIAHLPLDERLVELRKPEVRARIISEAPDDPTLPLMAMARNFERSFAMVGNADYEPEMSTSIASRARREGVSPEEIAYDLLLENEGTAKLLIALGNYGQGSLEDIGIAITHPDVVIGLGDGGAHYGLICDASYTTFMLTHWTRDRTRGKRLPLPATVRALSKVPAEMMGFADRGQLLPGMKADINVIDYDALRLELPEVRHDLPAGGRRIHQSAKGYRATIVAGEIILRDDQPTGKLPGRLIRGASKRGRVSNRGSMLEIVGSA